MVLVSLSMKKFNIDLRGKYTGPTRHAASNYSGTKKLGLKNEEISHSGK